MINRREIATSVILSIVTCGIYGLYWLYTINEDSKIAANDTTSLSGGMVILLSIVTCGIYEIYWMYMQGKRMVTAMQNAGLQSEDRSVVYLLLSIFGLSIVNYCLIQNDLNQIAEQK